MMRIARQIRTLYRTPWAIMPEVHSRIVDVFERYVGEAGFDPHATGFAQAADGGYELMSVRDGIAEIFVRGVIGKNLSASEREFGGYDLSDMSAALTDAVADNAVSAILLDVDSPGGVTTGVAEMYDEIRAASEAKPVIAYTDAVMASAAYWLSAGAQAIYATRAAEVGSIGVYMAVLDYSAAYAQEGVKVNLFKTGTHKGAGYPGTEITEEQKSQFQTEVNEVFAMFRSAVHGFNSGITDETMQGQIFIGESALRAGLVNSIASRAEAIRDLHRRAEV